MAPGKGHGGIKADNWETAGDVQDGLDDRLAHFGLEIVKLGGVIPGHTGAVVAMIHIQVLPITFILVLKYHGRITVIVVMILQINTTARVRTEIRPAEGIGRIRAILD